MWTMFCHENELCAVFVVYYIFIFRLSKKKKTKIMKNDIISVPSWCVCFFFPVKDENPINIQQIK